MNDDFIARLKKAAHPYFSDALYAEHGERYRPFENADSLGIVEMIMAIEDFFDPHFERHIKLDNDLTKETDIGQLRSILC